MELTLIHQGGTQVSVDCERQFSHTFDLLSLIPSENNKDSPPQPLIDPIGYGKAAYNALFQNGTLARNGLDAAPARIVLTTSNDELQAVPWEYAYDGRQFIVACYPFVRGLSREQRIATPELAE